MINKRLVLLSFLAFFLSGCFKKKLNTTNDKSIGQTKNSQGEFIQEGGTYIFSDDADEFILDEDSGDQFNDNANYVGDKDDFQWDNIVYDTDAGEVIQFDFDDTALKTSENHKIKHNIDLAKQELANNPKCKVAVKGHSCKIAKSELYNRAISQERAENVAKEYAKGGLPKDRLSAVGFGASELLTDEDGIQSQAPNRRVETDFLLE